ncbi:MAG TPA: ABC transporter permease [Bacteroidia bacterium]|nr:ABC transporter permease [Bacteroidia bacterium]
MKNILHIIRKEIIQVRRNKQMLPMLTILPVVQVIVLSFAANFEIRHLQLAVVDNDHSVESRQLVQSFTSSGFFELAGYATNAKDAFEMMQRDQADIVLEFPAHFGRDLTRLNYAPVSVRLNAVNSQKAGVSAAYALTIIGDYNERIRAETGSTLQPQSYYTLAAAVSNWYNPLLNYKTLMVPGILAVMVSLLIMIVSAMNIVREKEIGTIEQLNVTPVKKYQFILGKLIPFWVMGHIIFWVGITAGILIFHVPFVGNPLVLELFLAVYLPVMLGIGLFISTLVDTQQQAMFVAFFFVLVFILMSGFFTPVENMPAWAQKVDVINPMKYLVAVNRLVLLKGAGLKEISPFLFFILGYGITVNVLAVFRYRKTV